MGAQQAPLPGDGRGHGRGQRRAGEHVSKEVRHFKNLHDPFYPEGMSTILRKKMKSTSGLESQKM